MQRACKLIKNSLIYIHDFVYTTKIIQVNGSQENENHFVYFYSVKFKQIALRCPGGCLGLAHEL